MKKKSFFVLALGLMLTAGLVLSSCAGTEDDYKIGLLTGISKTDVATSGVLDGVKVLALIPSGTGSTPDAFNAANIVATTAPFGDGTGSFDFLKDAAGDDITPKTPDEFVSASIAFAKANGDLWAGSGKFDVFIVDMSSGSPTFTAASDKRRNGVAIYGNPIQLDLRSFAVFP